MEIELNNISYRDKISNFSYKFLSGSVTSIIGKSGSGKSLIGKIIMGVVNYDSGEVRVDGNRNYDEYKFLKDVGYVFQNPKEHFFCNTVYEEIAFGLKQFRFKLNKIDMQVRDAIKMVGLDGNLINKRIDTLSSGEAARVAIASSLVLNPKVLILDEATIYLDSKVKDELTKLIRMLKNKYNKTIIIMSNDMDFVCGVSDSYVLMDMGCIVNSDNIDKLDSSVLDKYGMDSSSINKFINLVKDRYNIDLGYVRDVDELIGRILKNG